MSDYLRITSDYFKVVKEPTLNNDSIERLKLWKRQTIIDDHGKSFLKNIPKYDGFVVIPSHRNYSRTIGNFYNRYSPLHHRKTEYRSTLDISYTLDFLKHIFGNQLEKGLDYLTILWKKPTQVLPILCLVGDGKNTGKSTFLNWLKLIFQDNMAMNRNEDLRSRFNSDWTDKLIIGVDEVFLDRKSDNERLKNLSTALNYKTEQKGKDKIETNFFGKFVLCSNRETNFIRIDENEIRYWIRKITPLKSINPDFLDRLKKETSFFVNYLDQRSIKTKKKTRMWFSKSDIHTTALTTLIRGTRLNNEKELLILLDEHFENFEKDVLCYSLNDLQELFEKSKIKISKRELTSLIRDKWKLMPKNSSYNTFYTSKYPSTNSWVIESINKKGRYYQFEKENIQSMLNC